MKKYSFLFIISAIILITAVLAPEFMYASLPSVKYFKVKKQNTNLTVAVKGKILRQGEKVFANLFISEDVFSKIKKGQNLTVSGSAFGNKTYKGKITQIGEVESGENSIAYVNARAKIKKRDKRLKSGFNIKADITVKKIKQKIIIPSYSILQDSGGEYIYKLNKNVAEKAYIKTGEMTNKGTVVKTNLKENEYIVLNPEKLKGKKEDVVIKNVWFI